MRKKFVFTIAVLLCVGITSTFTGCKKEEEEKVQGCTDVNANNFDPNAEENNGSCTYPTINVSPTNTAGDLSGFGGTASRTISFESTTQTIDWDMTIKATSGSFQLVVKDADGTAVIDKTLTAGSGPQDDAGISASGTPGTWTLSVFLTNFNGTGDYSLQ
ncbi:MAG: hypothetical protein ACJASF_001215 [Vicingaceae bacterium]|jgi:hypothetical protein